MEEKANIVPLEGKNKLIVKFAVNGYISGIYIFSFFLDHALCEINAFPAPVNIIFQGLSEMWTFLDRHSSYAVNLKRFKHIFSFAFILFLPTLSLLYIYGKEHYISVAYNSVLNRKWFFTLEVFIFSIFMPVAFLLLDASNRKTFTEVGFLYKNIDLWYAQATRIACSFFMPMYFIIHCYALLAVKFRYNLTFFKKQSK